MGKTILLLGLKREVVEDVKGRVNARAATLLIGTGVADLRAHLQRQRIDAVVMGGGLPLETRLELVGETFRASDTTTVHMKDVASGPDGFLPFVQSVIDGLLGREG
jgi:hypothetical protein